MVRALSNEEARSYLQQEGDDGWLVEESSGSGTYRISDRVMLRCDQLSERATALAPPFVRDKYKIYVVPNPPNTWHRRGRISIELSRRSNEAGVFDLSRASAGVSLWVFFAIRKAMRELESAHSANKPLETGMAATGSASVDLYLIDEPEQHLHPLAQSEMAKWLIEEATEGTCTIIATHSAPFLNLGYEDVEYLMVVREGEETVVKRATGDVLGTLEMHSRELGLPPAAVLQLTRGWLFVEGEDDRRVLMTLFGKRLREAGIRVIPFQGARRAKATFENLELLGPFGLPTYVILDNVRAAAITDGKLPLRVKTEEEKVVEQLIEMRNAGRNIEVIPFPYPDIVCALPDQAVRDVLLDGHREPGKFTGWDRMVEEWRGVGGPKTGSDFKAYVLSTLGFKRESISSFIGKGLKLWDGVVPDRHPLAGAVEKIIAQVSHKQGDEGFEQAVIEKV